jgi:predicted O-methyltransferase YrrM
MQTIHTLRNTGMIKKITKKLCDIAIIPTIQYVYDGLKLRHSPKVNKNYTYNTRKLPVEFTEEECAYIRNLFEKIQYPIDHGDDLLRKEHHKWVKENSLTMVPEAGIFSVLLGVKYVIENNIPGDIVECGVWRGGVSILMAGMVKFYKSSKRIYCFDTFSGMPDATQHDGEYIVSDEHNNNFVKSKSTLDDVRNNFIDCNLHNNVIFVAGDVSKTLDDSQNLPSNISLLRLDTDYYSSTKKELEVLYPLLSQRGLLIIDDYGAFAGCKAAVDEFFQKQNDPPFLSIIDRYARLCVKSNEGA